MLFTQLLLPDLWIRRMQSKASNPLKSSSICFVNQSSKSLIDLRQSNTAFYTNMRMRKGPFVSLGFYETKYRCYYKRRFCRYPTTGNCRAIIIKIFSETIRETMHETLKIPTSVCLNSVSGEKTKYSDHNQISVC